MTIPVYFGETVVDGVVVAIDATRTWYVDESGNKRAGDAAGRQALSCKWSDPLVAEGGVWRVMTAGDHAAAAKARLTTYAADARWRRQESGTTVDLGGGVVIPVRTDAQTQIFLAGARIKADADPDYEIASYKLGPGQYVTLTAAMIIAISDAVEGHIQACFAANADVDADIAAGTITTEAEIDATFAAI